MILQPIGHLVSFPEKQRYTADAMRKKGAHAVVYSILGPNGCNLCLIQPLLTSDAEASSQLSPGFSSPTRCSGVDSLAGYQRGCPLNHSESPAPFTANGLRLLLFGTRSLNIDSDINRQIPFAIPDF